MQTDGETMSEAAFKRYTLEEYWSLPIAVRDAYRFVVTVGDWLEMQKWKVLGEKPYWKKR